MCPSHLQVGSLSALGLGAGFDASFLEEPVMLLAFVLLGRALEAHAKVRGLAETLCVGKRWNLLAPMV